MNMETASLVLSSIAASLVFLIVLLQLYSIIRPRFLSTVTCWFCGVKSKVAYKDRNGWDCTKCEQYNGFDPDGGYNKVIPAQHDVRMNSVCSVSRPSPPPRRSNVLCASCNVNQQLKVQQLASFTPFVAARFDDEVDDFARHLDRVYALCGACEGALARELDKQGDWMMGLRMGAMRGKRWAEKQQASMPSLVAFVSKTCRISTTVISAALFVTTLLQTDSLPPTIAQQIPPEVTETLAAATPEVRLLLLGVGTLVQLGGFGGRWGRTDVIAVALWASANAIHWARHLEVAEDFVHWGVVMVLSLTVCLLGSAAAAFVRPVSRGPIRRPVRVDPVRRSAQFAHSAQSTPSSHSAETRSTSGQSSVHRPPSKAELNAHAQSDARKTTMAEEISHLLHHTSGNVSLPIGRPGNEEATARPIRTQDGLGQPMRSQDGLDTGIGRLHIGQAFPRRRLLEPSRFDSPSPSQHNRNVLHETDPFSTLSRSSSQSSGFASQCSQHDDNPFYRPAPRQQNIANYNFTCGDFVPRDFSEQRGEFSRPSSLFGDASTTLHKWNAFGAGPKSAVGDFHDVFEKPGRGSLSGKSYPSAASSQIGDDDFADKSIRSGFSKANRSRSGEFAPVGDAGFYPKSRSPASLDDSLRRDKDASPNSTFSYRTAYRHSSGSGSDSSFNDSNPNDMALVCANRFRDDASVHSVGYQPVYLAPGFAPGFAPGYVVNQCCHAPGRLATAMIVLGVVANLVLFVGNSGLWLKIVEAFR